MNRKVLFILACMFLFFYILNCLTPMSFGDDYVYSFVWEGHSLYEPLSEGATRLTSWTDLFASQLLHYFTWSGRIVNHTLEQFFLWTGKSVFNVCNTFVSVFLVVAIYWFSNKGVVNKQISITKLCGIFFALWAFSPKFSDVFLWVVGACNYLWPIVLLISFLLPYVRKYYLLSHRTNGNRIFGLSMFFLGLVAGCTNENTICCIIPVLIFFVYRERKSGTDDGWLYLGVAGLMTGYALLMFAPGNVMRLLAEKNSYSWLSWKDVLENTALLFLLFVYYQVFLWYFTLRSFYNLSKNNIKNIKIEKDLLLAKIMCVASFCMTFMMIFSPSFPPRSVFPGTVFLIIAACILLRVQEEYEIPMIKKNAKIFLWSVGIIYFVITSSATFYGSYYTHVQIKELLSFVKSSDYAKRNIIEIDSLCPVNDMVRKASWFHLMNLEISVDENDWRNVAFSRYYGIKGIRIVKVSTEANK